MAIVGILVAAAVLMVTLVVCKWAVGYLKACRSECLFPGPPTLPVLGNALSFLGATEYDIMDRFLKLWKNSSQVIQIRVLHILVLVVSDPDDIEKVLRGSDTQDKAPHFYRFFQNIFRYGLVVLNGVQWKAHRKATTPAFHKELLDRYQELFNEEAAGFLQRVTTGTPSLVGPNSELFAMRSFARTALDVQVDGNVDYAIPLITDILHLFPRTFSKRTAQPLFWSDTLFGMTKLGRETEAALDKVKQFGLEFIEKKRRDLGEGGGAEQRAEQRPTLIDILLESHGKAALTDDEMMDQLVSFFGAAIETLDTSFGWLFKILSLRHDVQDRVLQEVRDVVGTQDLHPDHLARLEYTERVIKEQLRLLPPFPFLARSNTRQATVFNGKHVPKDTSFLINIYGAHRDPRHWQEPLKFDPDRFLAGRSEGRHQYAYLPFSLGPRNCLGARYAMIAMKTLLATVLPKYRVDPVDDGLTDPASFPLQLGISARMPGGVRVVFTPRET